MIFQREPIDEAIDEAMPLIEGHYREIAWNQEKIPLSIDKAKYKLLESLGTLVCFVAREGGVMLAYSVFFISLHIHYSQTRYAANDVIFVNPKYRGKTGAKFIDYCEKELKVLGVDVITYHVKTDFNWGSMLDRKGFTPTDSIWQKYIGE